MEALLCWIAMGALGALLGYAKSRPVLGAILGFLLGPIGLAIIFVMSDKPRQTCPHCRSRIDAQATVCPKCTRDV